MKYKFKCIDFNIYLLDRYMWAYFFMFTKPNLPNNWRYMKNSLAKRFSKLPNDNFFQVNFSKQLEMLLVLKEFCRIFHILHHIESCGTCMEH